MDVNVYILGWDGEVKEVLWLIACRDEVLVSQTDRLMEVRMADEAVIDEEILLRSLLERSRGGADEATYCAEGTLVAHRNEGTRKLCSPDVDDALLERTCWEYLVVLPCTTQRE